jgi:hypothetical protein
MVRAETTVRLRGLTAAWEGVAASETVTTKSAVPGAVGVPERVPSGARERPGGRVPEEMDHV